MDAAILLKGVTKTFGSTRAVDHMDLLVPRGGLYGFIGPNGAGKTTSIRLIMSILFPDSGELSVLGRRSALEAKDRIGYLPEERGVYRKMRVGAFLTFMAHLKGVRTEEIPARVRRSLERVGLESAERKRCEELSKGMLQKIQFLAAIIHEPELLILDEPFGGLDPISMRLLRDLVLEEHRRGATILLSTHVMPNAEELCQHVVMIHRGRKVLDEQVSTIRSQYDPRTLWFDPLDRHADPRLLLGGLPGVERIDRVDGSYEILLVDGTDPGDAIRRITAVVTPARIELSRPRLEDVFVRIVSAGTTGVEDKRELRANLQDLGANVATV
jgi:ABC-2 type transport system ATP-binding protein